MWKRKTEQQEERQKRKKNVKLIEELKTQPYKGFPPQKLTLFVWTEGMQSVQVQTVTGRRLASSQTENFQKSKNIRVQCNALQEEQGGIVCFFTSFAGENFTHIMFTASGTVNANVTFGMSHFKRTPRATDLTNCPLLTPVLSKPFIHPSLSCPVLPSCRPARPPPSPPPGKSPGAIIKSVFTMSNTAEERSEGLHWAQVRAASANLAGAWLTTRAL